MTSEYTLPLSSPQAELAVVGGKGASLARMVNAGLPVPDGFHVTTTAYRRFVDENDLKELSKSGAPDEEIAEKFLAADFPQWIADDLRAYLEKIHYPLAIRSSSLLEDAQFRAYAGLYRTYMLPTTISIWRFA